MKKSILFAATFLALTSLLFAAPAKGLSKADNKLLKEALELKADGYAYLEGTEVDQDLYSALDCFELALDIFDELEIQDKNAVSLYNGIGRASFELGDYFSAQEFYEEAFTLSKKLFGESAKETAVSYNNLGLVNFAFQNYDDAFLYFEKSLALYKKLASGGATSASLDAETADVYNNIAKLYEARENFPKSQEYFEKALKIIIQTNGDSSSSAAAIYANISRVLMEKGDLKNAKTYAEKALEIQQEVYGDFNSQTAATCRLLAQIYQKSGNLNEALNLYNDALDSYSEVLGEYHPDVAQTYFDLGMLYYAQKKYKEASKKLKTAFDIYSECQNYDVIIKHALEVYFELKDYPSKFENSFYELKLYAIFEGISAAEDARIDLSSRKEAVMQKALPLYYAAVSLFAEVDDGKSAFYYSELLRSRGFLDEIGTEVALNLRGVTEEERTQFKELTKKIQSLSKKIAGQNEKQKSQIDSGAISSYKDELTQANKNLSELKEKIIAHQPKFEYFMNPEPVDFDMAKDWCGKDRAVLEYVIWDDDKTKKITPYCLVISKNKVTCVPLDSEFDFSESAKQFRELITDHKSLSDSKLNKLNGTLYQKLVEPVIPALPKSVQNIVIVPDGAISFIPFDVLSPDGNVFFGSAYNLSLSPSVSVSMMNNAKSAGSSKKMLGIGNAVYSNEDSGEDRAFKPKFLKQTEADKNAGSGSGSGTGVGATENLIKKYVADEDAGRYFAAKEISWCNIPGTGEEIHNIQSKVFGSGNFQIIEASGATEQKLKELSDSKKLSDYSVLHFACHGYYDVEYPQMSSIVFGEVSKAVDSRGKQDGYLTLSEAAVLDINANLVNLSACQTGLAKIQKGEGMTGLVRSFLVAGAKKVGVTLWCVDDEATCEFMTRMYSKVNDYGLTYEEAYSAVKAEFRKIEKWSSPYYWAAFILYE